MPDSLKNFAYSAIATAPDPADSGTSLVVTTGHGTRFPTAPFNAVVWPANQQPITTNAEIVRVTNIATDTFTITRQQESTSARSIQVGDQIAANITKKMLDDRSTPFYTVGATDSQYVTDGSADEVEIQAAIDAANTAGGGVVYIKEGTYIIAANIRVQSNVHLTGDGFSTILKYADSSDYNALIENYDTTNGNTNIIISNLTINGNKAAAGGTDPRDMIWLKLVSKSVIENVYVYDGVDSAIVVEQCTNCIVRSNILNNCTDIGIYNSGSSDCIFSDNVILNTGSYGIRNEYSGAVRNVYSSNYVYNCGQTSNVAGIRVINGDETIVSNNLVYQSGEDGISVRSAYLVVTGNQCYLNDHHGIYVSSAGIRGQITGNTCHANGTATSNTYSGIYLDSAAEMSVIGNRCGDTGSGTRQKYGIAEAGTANNNVIVGNMLQRNATAALIRTGAGTVMHSNSNSNDNRFVGSIYFNQEVDNGNSADADTIDWSTGNKQKSTLTGNATFTFTPPNGPCNLVLKLVQGGTGSYNPVWPATVKWAGGAEPTWSTGVGNVDIVSFYYDETNYYATAGLAFA